MKPQTYFSIRIARMENFFPFCFLLLVTWTASLSRPQSLEFLKAISYAIPEGNGCTVCPALLPDANSLPGDDGGKTTGKTTVCCSLLSGTEQVGGFNRRKRETSSPPPSDIPNLRVKGCGVRGSLSDFVVGGKEADFWPWMASIFVKANGAKSSRFTCGGVVISKHFVLTAAHCLGQRGRTVPASSVSVRVGSLRSSGGTSFPVRDVIVHENYRNNLHYDDIALLRTSRDMEVKQVVPVCLPSTGMYNSNFYKRQSTVLGWGDVSYGGVASEVLMEAILPVISNKRCDSRYKRLAPLSLPRGIIDTQLCAGAEDGSTDACQGDSGGPLVLEDRAGKWNVIGIVSFGYRCGEPEYPGVYTKVARYLKWLQTHTDIARRST